MSDFETFVIREEHFFCLFAKKVRLIIYFPIVLHREEKDFDEH